MLSLFHSLSSLFESFSQAKIEAKTLHELPDDVLHLIFEQLKIRDMLDVIECHPVFVEPTIMAFRYAYAEKIFKLNGNLFQKEKNPNQTFEEHVTLRSRFIDVADYNITVKFLETFGSSIKNLNINYNGMKESEIITINRLIRENCNEKLKHFGMAFVYKHQPEPVALPHVESITFSQANFSQPIDLNEIYPNMQRLEIGTNVFVPKNVIDRHFPRLKHFKMRYPIHSEYAENQIALIFQKNPQINSLTIGEVTTNYLRFLCNILPNLEYLELDDVSFRFITGSDASVHFDNVKKFTFRISAQVDGNVVNIPFAFGHQLTEVKMDSLVCSQLDVHWMRFLESNHNIQKFSFNFVFGCSLFAHFPDIQLSNLKEFTLKGIDFHMAEEMDEFLRKLGQWASLEMVHFVDVPRDQFEQFEAKLTAEWTIVKLRNANSNDSIDGMLVKA